MFVDPVPYAARYALVQPPKEVARTPEDTTKGVSAKDAKRYREKETHVTGCENPVYEDLDKV